MSTYAKCLLFTIACIAVIVLITVDKFDQARTATLNRGIIYP